ncbi:recombinase family protein [Oscillospiraceae bacterium MB08-C2-2]|nr:recombinase family protein [Oscillospiraceae bacterium MB08-C2-2]
MARIRKKQEGSALRQRWQTALYVRLSREDGREVSLSIENQTRQLMEFQQSRPDELELAGLYVDDGCTGTDSQREGFQKMLEDIRAGKVNCVVVKDLSRLSRNYSEAGEYIERFFVEHDVRFISLGLPPLDSYAHPEQMSSIAVPIQNVINDDFCKQTSLKVREVLNAKRRRGEFIGAFAPYGYCKHPEDKHRLAIDAPAADVVKNVFQWYAREGLSKSGIVQRLNRLGIPNPAGYKKAAGLKYQNPHTNGKGVLWSTSTLTRILQNPIYLGHMVQGRQRVKSHKVHTQVLTPSHEWFVVENTHPPLVEEELFEQARRLQERDTRVAPQKNTLYLFSGFLRCGDCGKALTRKTAKGYVYYACRTYSEQSKEHCTKHSINEKALEQAVLRAVQAGVSLLENPAGPPNEPGFLHPIGENPLDILLKNRRQEQNRAAAILDSLYADWKTGEISKEQYQRLKKHWEEEAERLKDSIQYIQTKKNDQTAQNSMGNPVWEHLKKHANIPSLDRSLLTELVDSIYVFEGNAITIRFQCASPFLFQEKFFP